MRNNRNSGLIILHTLIVLCVELPIMIWSIKLLDMNDAEYFYLWIFNIIFHSVCITLNFQSLKKLI